MLVMSIALTALGFLIAWRMDSTQGFHAIMSVFLLPMWLLSGAFFPMDVGGWLGWIIRINPLTYGVAGLRHYLQNVDVARRICRRSCDVLDRIAGVRGRDVRRRLVDRRQANDRRFAMSAESNNESPTEPAADANASRTGRHRRCRTCSASRSWWRWSTAVGNGGRYMQFEQERGQAIPANAIGPPLKEFELTERSGKPFRSIDMRGRVWVATLFLHNLSWPVPAAEREIQVLNANART